MIKQLIIIVIGVLVGFSSTAQVDMGVNVSGGMGKINKNNLHRRDYQTYTNEYRPNWLCGFEFQYNISKKSCFELGIFYNQINYFWGKHEDFIVNGQLTRILTENNEQKSEYISFPITYGFKINRFKINMGIQNSFLIKNTGYLYYSDISGIEYKQFYDWETVNKMDFSLTTSLTYYISKRVALECKCNYGVFNIASHDLIDYIELFSRQFLLGVRYNFLSIASKKE